MKIETQHILVHIIYPVNIPKVRHLIISTPYYRFLAMSKTPHTQYLCMFARHGNFFYHSKFIVTTSSKWYN